MSRTLPLFANIEPPEQFSLITTDPEIDQQLAANAVVAMGVSGGKDSSIAALATSEYLDSIGHTGERVLIHSDLGRVEWKKSIEVCQKLSDRLGIPLIVVERKAGDLMDRWLSRWQANVERYCDLLCVKLILPWSTPSMRFCTSELKTAIICAELARRYAGKTILNVTGIRRAESSSRSKAPISQENSLLTKANGTRGYDWHPIIDLATEEVYQAHNYYQFPLHEAYTIYGSSRVSCSYCIMGNLADLKASSRCKENHEIYREMCGLEIESAFSFQSNQWLSDIAPHLLSSELFTRLPQAKLIMKRREDFEALLPKHLLYEKGWPKVFPTHQEAEVIASVRQWVADLQGFTIKYKDAESVMMRYAELIDQRANKLSDKYQKLLNKHEPTDEVALKMFDELQAALSLQEQTRLS